jgi:hypothetical protein
LISNDCYTDHEFYETGSEFESDFYNFNSSDFYSETSQDEEEIERHYYREFLDAQFDYFHNFSKDYPKVAEEIKKKAEKKLSHDKKMIELAALAYKYETDRVDDKNKEIEQLLTENYKDIECYICRLYHF